MGDPHAEAVVIRPATAADAEGIARVHTTSWRETYGRFVDDPDTSAWFDVGRRLDLWRANLAQRTFATVVADGADGTDSTGRVRRSSSSGHWPGSRPGRTPDAARVRSGT